MCFCIKDGVFIDGACGTGGILTVAEEYMKAIADECGKKDLITWGNIKKEEITDGLLVGIIREVRR
jgi:type I restriction-modification system DNA methylase subunit